MNNIIRNDLKYAFRKELNGLWTIGYQLHKSLHKLCPELNKHFTSINSS